MWVWIFLKLFPNNEKDIESELPSITILVASFNESSYIQNKIDNLLALSYPYDKLKIAFVTDGSNDDSNAIIEKNMKDHNNLFLFFKAERNGKTRILEKGIIENEF